MQSVWREGRLAENGMSGIGVLCRIGRIERRTLASVLGQPAIH
jgi:hypothetical protein